MRYWFTTHWPPVPEQGERLDVYLQDAHRDAAGDLAAGDHIFIYEYQSGPPLILNGKLAHRRTGAGAVICEAVMCSGFKPRDTTEAQDILKNGEKLNWAWIARTKDRTFGHLTRPEANTILGYKENYSLRGFNDGRGIKEIKPAVYHSLRAAFLKARKISN